MKYICLGIIAIFLVSSCIMAFIPHNTNTHHDSDSSIVADGNIVSAESKINLVDYSEGTEDTFVAHSEDSNYYYGHWDKGQDAMGYYEIELNLNLSDIKWNSSCNDSVILDYLEHNLTSDDNVSIGFDLGDHFKIPSNTSTLKVENGVLKCSYNTSSTEFIDGNFNKSGVLSISNAGDKGNIDIEINVLFLADSIESHDPNPGDGYYHYNVEKTY